MLFSKAREGSKCFAEAPEAACLLALRVFCIGEENDEKLRIREENGVKNKKHPDLSCKSGMSLINQFFRKPPVLKAETSQRNTLLFVRLLREHKSIQNFIGYFRYILYVVFFRVLKIFP